MNGFSYPWCGRIVVIAPECMGYRSLAAMAALAVFLILWQRPGLFRSFVLFASACVLAVLGNLCRIGFLMFAMFALPDEWYAPIHDSAGFAVMLIEALILGSVCDYLKRRQKKEQSCTK